MQRIDPWVAVRVGAGAVLVGVLAVAGACTDNTGPTYKPPTALARPPRTPEPAIGTFHVVITTTGVNPDSDGYLLTVDDSMRQHVRVNDTVAVTHVVLDTHLLRVTGAAPNCVPDTASSRSLFLPSERDTVARFGFTCFGSATPPELAGLQLLFVRRDSIYRTVIGGSGPVPLAVGQDPTWSPDGHRIAFIRASDGVVGGKVYVMDADGTNERLIATGAVVDDHAATVDGWTAPFVSAARYAVAWSPDGTRLALFSDSAIVIAPVDGAAGPVNLPGEGTIMSGALSGSPTWSPDGRHIAFVRGEWAWSPAQEFDVFVGDVDGTGLSNVRRLTDGSSTGTLYLQPAWSPDGKQIGMLACGQPVNGWLDACSGSRIMVMNADGSQPRTLAHAGGYARPTWSPDGQTIIFANTCWDYECPSAVLYVSTDGTREGVLIDDAHSPALHR